MSYCFEELWFKLTVLEDFHGRWQLIKVKHTRDLEKVVQEELYNGAICQESSAQKLEQHTSWVHPSPEN